ncbi:hypothetical protein MTO96_033552 [Rhipicephalus appendiculatus]
MNNGDNRSNADNKNDGNKNNDDNRKNKDDGNSNSKNDHVEISGIKNTPRTGGKYAAEKTEEEERTGATPDVYDSAVAALAKHFDTTCNLVVERHQFHRRIQFPGESIQEYVTAQQSLPRCAHLRRKKSHYVTSLLPVCPHIVFGNVFC